MILRDRDTTNGWTGNPDGSLDERRYYCQNWRADVVAITNSSGLPYEFVRYSAYGRAQVFAAADVNRDGVVNASDADDWEGLYTEGTNDAAIPVDFNFDGSSFDPTDDDDFDVLYALQSGFSNGLQLSSLGNRKGYAGYEFDQPVEAYHVRHRVYLPEVGRWTRRDPIGYNDDNNLFEYVRSMSVVLSDFYGLAARGGGCPSGDCGIEWSFCQTSGDYNACILCCAGFGSPEGCINSCSRRQIVPERPSRVNNSCAELNNCMDQPVIKMLTTAIQGMCSITWNMTCTESDCEALNGNRGRACCNSQHIRMCTRRGADCRTIANELTHAFDFCTKGCDRRSDCGSFPNACDLACSEFRSNWYECCQKGVSNLDDCYASRNKSSNIVWQYRQVCPNVAQLEQSCKPADCTSTIAPM